MEVNKQIQEQRCLLNIKKYMNDIGVRNESKRKKQQKAS